MSKDSGVVNIHGKDYTKVAFRIQLFREKYPLWTLKTNVIERTDEYVVMEGQILDETGRLVANGHAEEYRRASSINKTSALENAETSAIGRALASFGLGGTEFASADEVARAVSGQKPSIDEVDPNPASMIQVHPDREAIIRHIADTCIAKHAQGNSWGVYEEFCGVIDNDERLLLWKYLKPHSKVRACIKEMAELDKKPEAA